MPYGNVSQTTGTGIVYFDGQRERKISSAHLEDIRSRVTTHEGEMLTGKSAQKYMDRHSKECLEKDLAGSYKDQRVRGYHK